MSPIVRAAARGALPAWAVVSVPRREHIARVCALLSLWADALHLPSGERDRWRAAAWLHDALRDADPTELRRQVPPEFRELPDLLLHGPAAAERVGDGADEEIRQAIRFHTLGHPSFAHLGKALYLADFLEPGRDFERPWRASLRARMPREMDAVLVEVLAARIGHLLDKRTPLRPETTAFWNTVVRGSA